MSNDKNYKAGANAWGNYWDKGFLSTFVDAEQENYSGQIKEYWETAFSLLPNNATIADLGAGNGAILALAKEFMRHNNISFKLLAIDYADISSSSDFYGKNTDIELHPNTRLERTTITSNSIDLCVSQFGFEYADTTQGAAEVFRILKPSGKFNALMHHHDSEVSKRAESALQQITLCNRSQLSETTVKLLRRLQKLSKSHRSPNDDIKATQLRNFFNDMAARLNKYADELFDADHVTYFLNELGHLFGDKAKGMTFDEKVWVVEQLKSDSDGYYQRMKSMLDASSDQAKIVSIVDTFEKTGYKTTPAREFFYEDQKFAWILKASKPG